MAFPLNQTGSFDSTRALRYDPHFGGHDRGNSGGGGGGVKPKRNIAFFEDGSVTSYLKA